MTDSDDFYAWVSREPNGNIYRVGAVLPGMGHQQLLGRSLEVMERMRPLAKAHAKENSRKVWLRRYTMAEDLGDA